MQIGKIKNKSKKFLSVNKYHPMLVVAAKIALLAALLIVTFALSHVSGWKWLMIYGLALIAVFYIFLAPVEYSVTDFYLRSYNLKYAENFKLFAGFKKENFWKSVLLRLIRTGIGLGFTALLIVPGIIFLLRTAFVYFVINNNPGTKAWDAIRESNQLMKGHTVELFKICCTFIGWFLLGIITFGLAFVYVSPYYHTVKSVFFRNVVMGVNDAGIPVAPQSKTTPGTSPQKEDKIALQIAELERQLKALKAASMQQRGQQQIPKTQQTAQFKTQTQTVQNPPPQPRADVKTPPQGTEAQIVHQAAHAESVTVSEEPPLVLDAVGDIKLTSGDRVEEVELPPVKPVVKSRPTEHVTAPETFATREIEIMENESFEDFKKRVAQMRKTRDFAENQTRPKESVATPSKANAASSEPRRENVTPPLVGAEQKKPLTREEILEKLKRERENRIK